MISNIIKDRGDHFRDVTEKTEDRQNVHLLEWEKELEKIMDKNTTNLTKTGDKDFNPPEISRQSRVKVLQDMEFIFLKSGCDMLERKCLPLRKLQDEVYPDIQVRETK